MSEILGGSGLHRAFKELGIKANRTYKGAKEPYYEVWELSKDDLKKLEWAGDWDDTWGWFRHAKGSRMGTAVEILTVHCEMLIGWETIDQKVSYDCLTDYFSDGLGVHGEDAICALAVDLARANGLSMARLFEKFEG